MSVDLTLEVSDETISNIMITAFDANYGGSWYWAVPDWIETPTASCTYIRTAGDNWTHVYAQVNPDEPIGDVEQDKPFVVTRTVVERGIQLILTGKVGIRSDLLAQVQTLFLDDVDIDADAADCIIQAGVFGELVYG